MNQRDAPEDDAEEQDARRVQPALSAFDDALRALTPIQRRTLRLLFTGARIALVAGAVGEERRTLVSWIGADHVFAPALHALQRHLDATAQATLRVLVAQELRWDNDELLDAEQWAMLALIRAIGRFDARFHVLDRTLLRHDREKP